MQLQMPIELAAAYTSQSQRARIITEAWGRDNFYCPSCDSAKLEPSAVNNRVVDFVCLGCKAAFQLKSQAHAFSRRIVDSAYEPMRRAVEQGQTPHFFALHYDRRSWRALNLTLLPSFALTISCLEKRKPLALTARRHGWVGCNILLFKIPPDARIHILSDGKPADRDFVRRQFNRLRPLEKESYKKRGWTLEVLNIVRSLNKRNFDLAEIYERSSELKDLHPGNLHVREKIRQQLQRLRDLGIVEFLGGGRYVVKP